MDHINEEKGFFSFSDEQDKKEKTKKGTADKSKKIKVTKMSIFSISSIPLVMTLGNSMLIPVLPNIERQLGISSFKVSMIITVYSILAILLIPVAGYLSDHIGRKKSLSQA